MTLSPGDVIIYAADTVDYEIALAAAAVALIDAKNVSGNYSAVWTSVASGSKLVIAVGSPADSALFYNPCGWSNPAGTGAGNTPFSHATAPVAVLPGSNKYEVAAGTNRRNTWELAVMLAYYAVYGAYPTGYTLPATVAPVNNCVSTSSANVSCPC